MGHTPFPTQARGFPRTPPSWEGVPAQKDTLLLEGETYADLMERMTMQAQKAIEGDSGLGGEGGEEAARKAEEIFNLTKLPDSAIATETKAGETDEIEVDAAVEKEVKMYEDALKSDKLGSRGKAPNTYMHMSSHMQCMYACAMVFFVVFRARRFSSHLRTSMTSREKFKYHGAFLRGGVAQVVMRDIAKDPSLKDEYKKLHGHAAKNAFRKKFLETKLAAAKEKLHVKREKHTVVDSSVGTYMSFYRIWEHEGKDPAGFKAIRGI